MANFEGKTFFEGTVEFTIHEHIAVLDRYEGREVPWTKEVNIVSWNGGPPKVDLRDWSEDHTRMSRGITLTEEQAMKLAAALVDRYHERTKLEKSKTQRNCFER